VGIPFRNPMVTVLTAFPNASFTPAEMLIAFIPVRLSYQVTVLMANAQKLKFLTKIASYWHFRQKEYPSNKIVRWAFKKIG
jgi:hypothetical protein